MPESFIHYRWLGLPPEDRPADFCRLSGIERCKSEPESICSAARGPMFQARDCQVNEYSAISQQVLNEPVAAYAWEKTSLYDDQLRSLVGIQKVLNVPLAAVVSGEADRPSKTAGSGAVGRGLPTMRVRVAALLFLGSLICGLATCGCGTQPSVQPPPQVDRRAEDTPPPAPPPPPSIAPAPDLSPPPESQPSQQIPKDAEEEEHDGDGEFESLPVADISPEETEGTAENTPVRVDKDPESKGSLEDIEVTSTPEERKRQPVPDSSEQQAMRELLDETFDSTRVRTSEEQLALGNKLAALAEEADDVTERFVLLRRASELASESGDTGRMLELVERIAEEFEVDRLLAQSVMLIESTKRASGEQQIRSLVNASTDVIDELAAADRFDLAVRLAESVHLACRSSAASEFRPQALGRRRELEELRERWEQVQAARTTLESNPDDEAAHTVLGRWYCFVRGDWDRALPHLAKGSEDVLRKLAGRELNNPPDDAAAQVELADAWWELAQTTDANSSRAMLARAAHWYEEAKPRLASVLLRQKVEQRLKELVKLHERDSGQPEPVPSPAVAPFDAARAKQYQQAWADYLDVPVEMENSIGMKFVLIPPGEFMMGATAETQRSKVPRWYTETPQHQVRIIRPFALGMYPVTQAEFQRVMGINPSRFKGNPTRPVEQVSWNDAVEFCHRLSRHERRVYRLPTEAEWEYACRAGTTTLYSFGDNVAVFGQYGWCDENSAKQTHSVGRLRPNAFGLFDMHGNVWELCGDPPDQAKNHVSRGGCWLVSASLCRSVGRNRHRADNRHDHLGFRVVLLGESDRAGKPETPSERPMPQQPAIQEGERPARAVQPSRSLSDFEKLKRENPQLFPEQ